MIDTHFSFVRFKGSLAYFYKAEFFLDDDSLIMTNIRALQNGVFGFLRSTCPANKRNASGFIDHLDVSSFRFRMVRKASSISPHIMCNNKVLKVIGIQDYFIVNEDDCLSLISKLLPLGIVPRDCSTPAKKARREGEKDVS